MGWTIWALLSALGAAASYLVAVLLCPDHGTLDRATAAFVVMPALLLGDMLLCGFLDHFAPWPLALVGLALFGGTAALAGRRAGATSIQACVQSDVRAPIRLFRDAWQERELSIVLVAISLVPLTIVLRMVWYFRSWTWDPVWYHVPMTSYAIQEQSLRWIETNNVFLQGYPRNVELLAAWNCVFPRDNRFDETGQLLFVPLGMLVVAAWSRRVGASRPLAAALGAAWFLLPPVFLQAHSTHVDLACGALLGAAMYYLSDENTPRSRWLCLLAMGLYVGSKFAGAFHLAVLAPWLAVRAALELRGSPSRRTRTLVDIALSIAVLSALGLPQYIKNFVHTGNPVWPFITRIPLRELPLPGTTELGLTVGGPTGAGYFWAAPGEFMRMLSSWFDAHPFYAPDVRSGGFGRVFRWLLLPAVLIVAADAVRLRNLRKSAPLIALFAMCLVIPAAWWPRFTIGAAMAALVAFAIVHGELPKRALKLSLSLALVALSLTEYSAARAGFITYPKHLEAARAADAVLRSALQLDTFLWTTEAGLLRERELKSGDVVAYDESTGFLAEFFARDYRTRVVFVSSEGDPAAYLARLRKLRARWIGVRRNSPAAAKVAEAGAQWLFAAPTSDVDLWRAPPSFGAEGP